MSEGSKTCLAYLCTYVFSIVGSSVKYIFEETRLLFA